MYWSPDSSLSLDSSTYYKPGKNGLEFGLQYYKSGKNGLEFGLQSESGVLGWQ